MDQVVIYGSSFSCCSSFCHENFSVFSAKVNKRCITWLIGMGFICLTGDLRWDLSPSVRFIPLSPFPLSVKMRLLGNGDFPGDGGLLTRLKIDIIPGCFEQRLWSQRIDCVWLSKMCKDLGICKLWKAFVFSCLFCFQFHCLFVFTRERRESYPRVKLFI